MFGAHTGRAERGLFPRMISLLTLSIMHQVFEAAIRVVLFKDGAEQEPAPKKKQRRHSTKKKPKMKSSAKGGQKGDKDKDCIVQ